MEQLNKLTIAQIVIQHPQYESLSLSALIDLIVSKHHRFVKDYCLSIYNHLKSIAGKHGDKYPELKKVIELFSELKDELEQHIKKEELILFPRIKRIEEAYNRNGNVHNINIESPIAIMETEHETVYLLLDAIRKLTCDYSAPKEICKTYKLCFDELKLFEQDLHLHIHLQNNILFPGALRMQSEMSHAL
ncbi:MAG: hemerythrin domain-containing protein [Bacteroidia bacterium]